jgi:antirestriction protein ArdC
MTNFNPILEAERIWTGYPNPPSLHYGGNRAVYKSTTDQILMPPRNTFESPEEFYSVLFHEAGHSTGHKTRLDRDLGMKHGHQAYSKEELVAEMCSAFLCAKAGISQPVIANQVAYIADWSTSLRDDPKLFVTAAGRGQKAADFILGVGANDECEADRMCA